MGCVPSSTYPEHIPRNDDDSAPFGTTSVHNGQNGDDYGVSRQVSVALMISGEGTHPVHSSSDCSNKPDSLCTTAVPPLRMQSQGDVGADGIGLASTTYITSSGKKYKFLYGRPVGFSGAEEIVSCLDDGGRQGNLYRLVRSKLRSIGEEEASMGDDTDGAGRRHTDTSSESEAKERGEGMNLVACSVTARRQSANKSAERALQEQYVVALLGTDTILDTSAIERSRQRQRLAVLQTKSETSNGKCNNSASETPRLSLPPPPSPPPAKAKEEADGLQMSTRRDLDLEEETDYQLFPQDHYSTLPAQRQAGAAVPIALCPPSRILRVPVQYSAVEHRMTAAPGKPGSKDKNWKDIVLPQRVFRLATSETRTWAFYNDSEYVMHVYTLFDRSSKLEPRDSTRLWPSRVFDDGNEAPTPPPVFFGLFFDEDGEEAVPKSEMPDSVTRRPQHIFGTRGMWIAELLIPPRSTRLFVEGKIRGAYRMLCTRLGLDDVVAATEMAQRVARRRNARHAPERLHLSLWPYRSSAAASASPSAATKAAAAAEEQKVGGAAESLPLTSFKTMPHIPHRGNTVTAVSSVNGSASRSKNSAGLRKTMEAATRTQQARICQSATTAAAMTTTHPVPAVASHHIVLHTAANMSNPLSLPALRTPRAAPSQSLPPSAAGPAASPPAFPVCKMAPTSLGADAKLRALPLEAAETETAAAATTTQSGGAAVPPPLSSPEPVGEFSVIQKHTAAAAAVAVAAEDTAVNSSSKSSMQTELPGDHPVRRGKRHDSVPGDNAGHKDSSCASETADQNAPHFSPSLSSFVARRIQRDGDNGDNGAEAMDDTVSDAGSSCVEFAKIRPDRQRTTSLCGEVPLSGSTTSAHCKSTDQQQRIAPVRKSGVSRAPEALSPENTNTLNNRLPPWQPKMSTLTPQSTISRCRSGTDRLSTSSYRTVVGDDSG